MKGEREKSPRTELMPQTNPRGKLVFISFRKAFFSLNIPLLLLLLTTLLRSLLMFFFSYGNFWENNFKIPKENFSEDKNCIK